MNKQGEIIIVEDDEDDRYLLLQALKEIGVTNPVTVLKDGYEAYKYFNDTDKDPFLIISDINMPKMSGTELRDKMQQVGELRLRTVPFLFMTTATAAENIISAYANSVQGFFIKPPNYNELKDTFSTIIEYWSKCTAPVFHTNENA
jgi:CheY-like chemotaxis protein